MQQLDEPKRASDAIAEALIAEIRRGDIAADAPLPTERELCDRFHASRPTVREALAQLQIRRYAVVGSGKRPRASKPSLTEVLSGAGVHIREILGDAESGAHLEQMRQFIETGAARKAAMDAGNVQIAKMRAALEQNHDAIGTANFPATDIAFHRALVSVIGNPVILTLHDLFVSGLLSRRPTVTNQADHDRRSYDEHRQIYQAILEGDSITATSVMDRHLERSYRDRLTAPKSATDQPRQDARS